MSGHKHNSPETSQSGSDYPSAPNPFRKPSGGNYISRDALMAGGASLAPSSAPVDPLIGERLANTTIKEKIGQGSFGAVYRAEHVFLDKTFAVKTLKPHQKNHEEVIARFQREAQTLSCLEHENIVSFYDFGRLEQHGFYMVMEYLHGESLSDRIRSISRAGFDFPLRDLLMLVRKLCGVLSYIHKQGIVHRDLKPSNIFLQTLPSDGERLKLIDFGIVSVVETSEAITKAGASMGSANYVAPEQINAKAPIDGRADLYALGTIVYRLLTGKLPLKGENLTNTIILQLKQPAPSLAQKAPERKWSPKLEAFVAKTLEKKREKRPPTARAFLFEFEEALEEQFVLELSPKNPSQPVAVTHQAQPRKREYTDTENELGSIQLMDTSPELGAGKVNLWGATAEMPSFFSFTMDEGTHPQIEGPDTIDIDAEMAQKERIPRKAESTDIDYGLIPDEKTRPQMVNELLLDLQKKKAVDDLAESLRIGPSMEYAQEGPTIPSLMGKTVPEMRAAIPDDPTLSMDDDPKASQKQPTLRVRGQALEETKKTEVDLVAVPSQVPEQKRERSVAWVIGVALLILVVGGFVIFKMTQN